jgi:hypothetical protein
MDFRSARGLKNETGGRPGLDRQKPACGRQAFWLASLPPAGKPGLASSCHQVLYGQGKLNGLELERLAGGRHGAGSDGNGGSAGRREDGWRNFGGGPAAATGNSAG